MVVEYKEDKRHKVTPDVASGIPPAAVDIIMATKPRYCRDCRHCQKTDLPTVVQTRDVWERWICTVDVKKRHVVSGLPEDGMGIRCLFMRKETGRCGVEGTLWQGV